MIYLPQAIKVRIGYNSEITRILHPEQGKCCRGVIPIIDCLVGVRCILPSSTWETIIHKAPRNPKVFAILWGIFSAQNNRTRRAGWIWLSLHQHLRIWTNKCMKRLTRRLWLQASHSSKVFVVNYYWIITLLNSTFRLQIELFYRIHSDTHFFSTSRWVMHTEHTIYWPMDNI